MNNKLHEIICLAWFVGNFLSIVDLKVSSCFVHKCVGKSADQKCDKKLVSIGKYSNTKFNSQGFYHFIRGGGGGVFRILWHRHVKSKLRFLNRSWIVLQVSGKVVAHRYPVVEHSLADNNMSIFTPVAVCATWHEEDHVSKLSPLTM